MSETKTKISARVIADSEAWTGVSGEKKTRLTTMVVTMPRIVLAEFNTHRCFCLSGDAMLSFDLPSPGPGQTYKSYKMSLREFADKWHNGAAEGAVPAHNGLNLNHLNPNTVYTTHQIKGDVGHINTMNLNQTCREGKVQGAVKNSSGVWEASGESWAAWRNTTGRRRFSLQSRLRNMRIRQVDETTGKIRFSTVTDCIISGTKPVYRISAGDYSTVATTQHRILTESGWKTLGDIVPRVDKICTYRYGTGAKEQSYQKIDGRWVSQWTREIRSVVAARQEHKCFVSGSLLGATFEIHHIKPKHERPDLAFDLDNVIAVTVEAHAKLHEKQGWQIGVPLGTVFTEVDAILPEGEMDTYDLSIAGEFENFFADGIVVHNSRNSASSRAIPYKVMREKVLKDLFTPLRFQRHRKGMRGSEYLEGEEDRDARQEWLEASRRAVDSADGLDHLGVSEQICNRILEPFLWHEVIISGTNWGNFLALRDSDAAEIHIAELARKIRDAFVKSEPKLLGPGEWHLPFGDSTGAEGEGSVNLTAAKIAAARCARISYLTHNQTRDVDEDLRLAESLEAAGHMSPFEHIAMVSLKPFRDRGNFTAPWVQYRKMLPCESRVYHLPSGEVLS